MIEIETLRRLVRFEAETGKLYWLPRPPDLVIDNAGIGAAEIARRWNTRLAGKEALTKNVGGYKRGRILYENHCAHRVIWALHYGRWPTEQIDHINGVRTDNRIENLREVSSLENSRNQRLQARNTSGVVGVSSYKAKWSAQIGVNGSIKYLGLFDKFEHAVEARKAAEVKFGFHANHGKAA
jgi:hypothetical protein